MYRALNTKIFISVYGTLSNTNFISAYRGRNYVPCVNINECHLWS